jgi:hypothetical protein
MRDLLRQHIMLSDREEQLKPLGLGKRNKTFGAVVDGVECLAGNAIDVFHYLSEHCACKSQCH